MSFIVATYSLDQCPASDESTRCLMEAYGPFATRDEARACAEKLPQEFLPHILALEVPS
jgi:hypothetical protein